MNSLPSGLKKRLDEDFVRYSFLLNFYQRGGEVCYDEADGLILYNSRYKLAYMSGSVKEHPAVHASKLVMTDDSGAAAYLMSTIPGAIITELLNVVFLGDKAPEVPVPEGVSLRMLTAEDIPFVIEHYDNPGAYERHIRERIEEGMPAAVVNGEIAAFAGIHEEGAMGLLEVLPAFRHRGIAAWLESELIRSELSKGYLPYCQVRTGNEVSFALQKKLGLTVDHHPCYWVGALPEELINERKGKNK